ncbi:MULTISPECIES: hypothetical protein [Paenibacillus]|uniref:hypothetical protein n=1 Tax=Paenibacillus TaxID=44249 RepID=UPI00096DC91C|nr:hypothetical protein [Paenibacillus odorifer]OMD18522.1 hypothetical protein BJP50_14440 [Paenibacillus odorifer]
MIKYLLLIKDDNNDSLVEEILAPILQADFLSEEVAEKHLESLERLKLIDELDVFYAVLNDLLTINVYKQRAVSSFLITEKKASY